MTSFNGPTRDLYPGFPNPQGQNPLLAKQAQFQQFITQQNALNRALGNTMDMTKQMNPMNTLSMGNWERNEQLSKIKASVQNHNAPLQQTAANLAQMDVNTVRTTLEQMAKGNPLVAVTPELKAKENQILQQFFVNQQQAFFDLMYLY